MLQWPSKINKCFSKKERAVDLNTKSLRMIFKLLLPRKTNQSISQEKGKEACSHLRAALQTRVSMKASPQMRRAARCNKHLNQMLAYRLHRTQQPSRVSQKFQLSVVSIKESCLSLAKDQMPHSQEQALCQLVLMQVLESIQIAQ